MIQTQDYCTRTSFISRKNITVDSNWPIALDIGYSAVKGMSPNQVFCFPSFARRFSGQMINIGEPSPNDIQYRSETGEVWNVGENAQNMLDSDDHNDSANSLYGRNRYFAPMFLVLSRVGLALGMLKTNNGDPQGKVLTLQTGLPPAYLRSDARYLKEVLAGHHEFEVRVGKGNWMKFRFELPEDNIRVMAQPMGSFFSAALANDATQTPAAKSLLGSNVLIFDAGFGTVDIYDIKNRQITSSQSFDDCGMKAVLKETSERIFQKYGTEIPVHAMQKYLRSGVIKTFDRRRMRTTHEKFEDLLEAATDKICMEAINRVIQMYNSLIDYDYLIITGGTGAAWQDTIMDFFSEMETLKVITANQNDSLSHIFSNVRGYYLYQIGSLYRNSRK